MRFSIVVICNVCGKGMIKIIPIIIGVLGSVAIAIILALLFGETVVDANGTEYIAMKGIENLQIFSTASIENIKDLLHG